MTPFRRLIALGVALGMVLTGIAAATPAVATPGGVEVSPDGVSYSSTYSGTLFTSIAHLVPGDSDQATFYLRNSATEPGFLRITLRDVVASDSDFAEALSVSASTAAHTGSSATLLEADPCWVLLEGQVVAPGDVVRVTTSIALGDLLGQSGQGATATAALSVALSGTATQLPPTDCGQRGTNLPVVALPGVAPPGAGRPTAPASVAQDANEGFIVTEPATELPVLSLPELLGLDPNTWRLFEEYLILIPIGSSVLGGIVFGIVAWRRRRKDDQVESTA